LDDLRTQIINGAVAAGATVESLSLRAGAGYFYVSGAISKTGGTVNFSFRVVPSMFHTRPGAYFRYLRKPIRVNGRTWPALEFRIEGLQTDVDRSWWV